MALIDLEIVFDPSDDRATDTSEFLYGHVMLTIAVDGRATPDTPARLHGHPDSWHPAEPGDVEIDGFSCVGAKFYSASNTKDELAAMVKQAKLLTSEQIEWLMTKADVDMAMQALVDEAGNDSGDYDSYDSAEERELAYGDWERNWGRY